MADHVAECTYCHRVRTLTVLEPLANAASLEATEASKDIQSHLPSETAPVTALLYPCTRRR
jgi:hypothetical protein